MNEKNILIGAQVFCWSKIINPLGHKSRLGEEVISSWGKFTLPWAGAAKYREVASGPPTLKTTLNFRIESLPCASPPVPAPLRYTVKSRAVDRSTIQF